MTKAITSFLIEGHMEHKDFLDIVVAVTASRLNIVLVDVMQDQILST